MRRIKQEQTMEVPFITGKMATGVNFTDREQETEMLKRNFSALVNTIIISPRRWGKTSLVNKALTDLSKMEDYLVAHVDVFSCRTEEQFYRTYANAILRASETRLDGLIAAAKKYLGSFGPTLKMGDAGQTVEISLGVEFKDKKYSFDEILDLPETIAAERGKKFIICIDEFQNVSTYTDSIGFQRVLRSHWQRHAHVGYCLYGSKRHMLLDIFGNYEMPFYKFGELLLLEKIPVEKWVPFIRERFEATGKHITQELARSIAEKVDCHSYYVQQLSQQVWLRTQSMVTANIVEDAFQGIVAQSSLLFTGILDSLTAKQISFLTAVANGERNFSSRDVLRKYDLGSSANIKNLKKVAFERDFVDTDSSQRIVLQDPVFVYWLKHVFSHGY